MKINDKSQELLAKRASQGKTEPPAGVPDGNVRPDPDTRPADDKFELSTTLKRISKMTDALKTVPEVRHERMAEIKGQIDAGQYQVDSRDVAEKMITALKKGPKV